LASCFIGALRMALFWGLGRLGSQPLSRYYDST